MWPVRGFMHTMLLAAEEERLAPLVSLEGQSEKPRLCLHVCCGVCASVALERLVGRYDVIAYWYNPNLSPADEYAARLAAARECCDYFGVVLVEGSEDSEAWLEAVKGLEKEPEGGRRCVECFRFRLSAAASWAEGRECRWLATTLTAGPQKDVAVVHELGRQIAEGSGLEWLEETFRKSGGAHRAALLARELGLYRQDYCGCAFSLAEKQARRGR